METLKPKKILLVDDDPLVLRLYEHALRHRGYQVQTAEDGVGAARILHANPPDAVVLDLMMPRMSGVDVLKYMRNSPELKAMPVVVLSNAYLNDMAGEALRLGASKALLKVNCNAGILVKALREVLGQVPNEAHAPSHHPGYHSPQAGVTTFFSASADPEVRGDARRELLDASSSLASSLRALHREFLESQENQEREMRLENFWRKVHFISATAGMAECRYLARMATVFEALLFAVLGHPETRTVSVMKTIHQTVDTLIEMIDWDREAIPSRSVPTRVLVVDDDPVCTRLLVSGLRQINFEVHSFVDPRAALKSMQESHYDLVLLDIEMPEIDGFELCRQLRELPGYKNVSVIFVTQHSGFKAYSRGVSSGGDDMIAKPVFPMELAVKATAHMLRRRHELSVQSPVPPTAADDLGATYF